MTASSKTRTILCLANRAIRHISRLRRLDFSTDTSQRSERNRSPGQRVGALFEGEGANILPEHYIWRAIEQAKRIADRIDERWAEALK